jgi:hypothetical protein
VWQEALGRQLAYDDPRRDVGVQLQRQETKVGHRRWLEAAASSLGRRNVVLGTGDQGLPSMHGVVPRGPASDVYRGAGHERYADVLDASELHVSLRSNSRELLNAAHAQRILRSVEP